MEVAAGAVASVRVVVVGGGPAGLYFAILFKKANPQAQVRVLERNQPDDTFGFGVVFSDATLENLERADEKTYREITLAFAHWDDIDIHYREEVVRSTGHGFSGLSRHRLLQILQRRCRELDVEMEFSTDVTDPAALESADLVLAADGVNSLLRSHYAEHFGPEIDWRPNRFVWLGTSFPFEAFTFYFKENEHGLFRVHAYRYEEGGSTFIVECTADCLERTGLADDDEDGTIAYCEALFAEELAGHSLRKNRSIWRSFPTVTNRRWHHENVVLVGDAAHTAHFSIGSGTKLAMEDAIELCDQLARHDSIPEALEAYESERRPGVESLQRAAQVSLEWFENTERYMGMEPLQFSFSLLTRSLRVTHENLRVRDPELVKRVDSWFAGDAERTPPPMFTPFRLRDLTLSNRVVVSPMCQYTAVEGRVGDWHLVHLGSRAVGGAGLVITEMTDVSRDGRISPGCAGMYEPEHVEAWRRITDFVHERSEAAIGIQLAHAGRKGSTRRLWEGMDEPLPEGNWPLISASPLPYRPDNQVPREMDGADLERVMGEFVRAAGMADEAGFDLLELHFAHGYLLACFISPLTNQRTDEFGGDLAGRMRFPLQVFDAVREVWPDRKPISVRISATDWTPGGIEPADAVEIARMLKDHGCDIVDVSAGQTVAEQQPRYGRLFQTPFAERIRLEAEIPTMTVGNVSSWADVNSVLAAGRADLCVLARAHLFDPYYTRHAAADLDWDLPWPDQYSSLDGYRPRFK